MDLSLTPFFLKAPSGHLLVNCYSGEAGGDFRHCVVHLPAFAEEMNKSRPMVNLAARKIAAQGYSVLVPDLFGCGDSEGSLGEADLDRWRQDMLFLLSWLQQQGAESIAFWGLRSGCLLAVDLLAHLPEPLSQRISTLIFWQPVLKGEQFINQFLRLRVAASMMSGARETVASLRERLEDEGELEVAGYALNADLIAQMNGLQLANLENFPALNIHWFEVVNAQKKTVPMAAKKLLEQWQQQGLSVHCREVTGEAFWSTQEIAKAPDLIVQTAAVLPAVNPAFDNPGATSEKPLALNAESAADFTEQPVVFSCQSSALVGILHPSEVEASRAVVLVVGGPQYRVGSHRQFVQLSRALAAAGVPVFRFDYRGMGDSEGAFVGFEGIAEDIRAAVDELHRLLPATREVVLWGLCDAATASSFYAVDDPRVTGLVMANPWARSTQGEAKAFLKHYYLQRLLSRAFWKKVFSGKFRPGQAAASLGDNIAKAKSSQDQPGSEKPLIERMEVALSSFKYNVLLLLSDNDLTAREFEDAASSRKKWRKILKRPQLQVERIAQADHTFSTQQWKGEVADITEKWLKSW